METRFCKCGCATPMPETSKWKYVRGHKPKTKKAARPRQVETEIETEEEPEYADLQMCESQLDAIWAMFSLNQKAWAVVHGLTAAQD